MEIGTPQAKKNEIGKKIGICLTCLILCLFKALCLKHVLYKFHVVLFREIECLTKFLELIMLAA